MYSIGVDFHKRYSHVTVMNDQGQVLKTGRVPNTAEAVRAFVAPYREGGQAVVEATRNWPVILPLRRIEEDLLDVRIPVRLSNSAGTFLCNATMYTFLIETRRLYGEIPCGFVHLPYLPEQVAEVLAVAKNEQRLELHQRADLSSMSLDMIVRAVRIVLEAVASTVVGVTRTAT